MEGHIYIYGEITSYQGKDAVNYGAINPREVQDQIQANKEASELVVHINSPGGDVDAGFAIYDILKGTGKKITTMIEGQCYSIATVIFLSGSVRLATENSEFLIHLPMSGASGNAADLEKRAELLRKMEVKAADFYAAHTTLSSDSAMIEMEKDAFMDLAQAKEYGFITEIVETVKAVAKVSFNTKKMAEIKDDVSVLDQIKALFAGQKKEEVKAIVAKAADGRSVEFFERNEGEISVNDKVTVDGAVVSEEIVMASGDTYKIENGVLQSIEEKVEVDVQGLVNSAVEAALEPFKSQLEEKENTIKDLQTKMQENETIFNGLKSIVGETVVDEKEVKQKVSDKVENAVVNPLLQFTKQEN